MDQTRETLVLDTRVSARSLKETCSGLGQGVGVGVRLAEMSTIPSPSAGSLETAVFVITPVT